MNRNLVPLPDRKKPNKMKYSTNNNRRKCCIQCSEMHVFSVHKFFVCMCYLKSWEISKIEWNQIWTQDCVERSGNFYVSKHISWIDVICQWKISHLITLFWNQTNTNEIFETCLDSVWLFHLWDNWCTWYSLVSFSFVCVWDTVVYGHRVIFSHVTPVCWESNFCAVEGHSN